jgi:hypothetical protein
MHLFLLSVDRACLDVVFFFSGDQNFSDSVEDKDFNAMDFIDRTFPSSSLIARAVSVASGSRYATIEIVSSEFIQARAEPDVVEGDEFGVR